MQSCGRNWRNRAWKVIYPLVVSTFGQFCGCVLPAASFVPVTRMQAAVTVVLALSCLTESLSSQELQSQQYHHPFRQLQGLNPSRVQPQRVQPQRVKPQRVQPSHLHIHRIQPQRLRYLDPLAKQWLFQERQNQVVEAAGVIRQLRPEEDDQSAEEYGFSVQPLSLDEEVAWLRGGRLSDWGAWLRGGGDSRDGSWIQGGGGKVLGEIGQEDGQELDASLEV